MQLSSTSAPSSVSTPAPSSLSAPVERSVIDPETLDAGARRELIDELYAAHEQIFDGVNKAAFAAYVVNSPAERTRIETYRAEGRVVGYMAVHTFVRTVAGEQWVVIRAESGKLPGYRQDAKARLMIRELLRACVRYPSARKGLLGCFVHPSAYLALHHVAPRIYPRPDAPTPAPIARAMAGLANAFGLERLAERGDHDRRKVGWITQDSAADRRSWEARTDAATRFFLRANPGYAEGEGLVVLGLFSFADLIEGSTRHALRAGRRRLQRTGVRAGLRLVLPGRVSASEATIVLRSSRASRRTISNSRNAQI